MIKLKKLFLSAISILLLTVSVHAFKGKADSILVSGKIFNNEEQVHKPTITVYNGNKVIKKVQFRSAKSMRFYVPRNANLTIEIAAEKFHTKRFMFDTTVPKSLKRAPGYVFDMDIFTEDELSGVNTSILDFPIGVVRYNEKKKIFIRDKDYTKKMKKDTYKLLENAKQSKRASDMK